MAEGDNADAKGSENLVEGEDSVRTVNCLRGRLLAERMASRSARDDAEKLGNKLVELENMLKDEAKSRNRAEKRLKFLMKRLQSMNIPYVMDESQHSEMLDKSDISSASSTASIHFESQESKETDKSPKGLPNLQQNDPQLSLLSLSQNSSATEGSSSTALTLNLIDFKGQECEMGSNENPMLPTFSPIFDQINAQPQPKHDNDSMADEQSVDEGLKQEDDHNDPDSLVDNSMALVPVDMPQKNQSIDPEVLDTTVKDVLDSLRRAKEQLQSSMERRRMNMIKVG